MSLTERWRVEHGDCRDLLRTLPDASIDSIVTDPPYELGFMGKSWDSTGIAYQVDVWRECLRVLKHGGHLMAFGGSRTYHRLACAIEDAGFQIRDQIMWVYGSGFPKSLDVSKAIDKQAGAERSKIPATGSLHKNRNLNDDGWSKINEPNPLMDSTLPVTDAAKQWAGWGTALKPAHEPIVLARKPLDGTVAQNVIWYGTGALNIDGCRVGDESVQTNRYNAKGDMTSFHGSQAGNPYVSSVHSGRFPANFIHDGSDEVLELFPDSASTSGGRSGTNANPMSWTEQNHRRQRGGHDDSGSAARFFYCAKANKKDRNEGLDDFEPKRDADRITDDGVVGDNPRNRSNTEKVNHHPTVKPTMLMRYLCRLITPPDGVVLDPFTGSGSTGKAAMAERLRFIGFDQSAEYVAIAQARIGYAEQHHEG